MRLLICSFDNSKAILIGGKHIHQELLQKGWQDLGHQVDYCYPIKQAIPSLLKRAKNKILWKLSASYQLQKYQNNINSRMAELKNSIKERIDKFDYDFISAHDVLAAKAAGEALKESKKTIPLILTVHGYFARETLNYGYYKKSISDKVYQNALQIEKDALNFSDKIIAVDSRIKNYLKDDLFYKKPIKVQFNAIDDSRFFPVSEKEKKELREKLKLAKDKKIILTARRLVKKNGVIYAVQAIDILINQLKRQDIILYIIGDGKERKNITNYIRQKKLDQHVILKGMVAHHEVDSYYKAADILLMPSTLSDGVEEATSLSMLEGLVCGLLVIASAIGGLKEVIKTGENGFLVPDKDPQAISQTISKIIDQPALAEKISQQAFSFAKKNHGYKEHAAAILDFFKLDNYV